MQPGISKLPKAPEVDEKHEDEDVGIHSFPVEPTTVNITVEKNVHVYPPGYITVQDSLASLTCATVDLSSINSDIHDDDKVTMDFEDGTVGKLSPTGKIHFVDKIDVSTMLRKCDKSGKHLGIPIDIKDWKWRVGILKFTEVPEYNVKLLYQVGWVSRDAYKDIFGMDYYEDLPEISQHDLVKVKYPTSWNVHPNTRTEYYAQRSLPPNNIIHALKVSSCSRMSLYEEAKDFICPNTNPDIYCKVPHVELIEYLTAYKDRPVKSVNSPMFKCLHWAIDKGLISDGSPLNPSSLVVKSDLRMLRDTIDDILPNLKRLIIKQSDIIEDSSEAVLASTGATQLIRKREYIN